MNSKYRKQQLLPRLSSSKYPKRLLFFDTETILEMNNSGQLENKLRLGCAIYVELDNALEIKHEEKYTFNTISEFISIVKRYDRTRKQLVLIAHNTKFDIEILDLPNEFYKLGYKIDFPITNYGLLIWKVYTNKGSLLFLDTYNYIPRALELIGKDMNFPKIEINFDRCSYSELENYCMNDCAIIELFTLKLIRFMFTNNLGTFMYTTAGNSFVAYRKRFMNIQPRIHTNPEITELERNGYYGGRTECFRIGTYNQDTYYYLDINSAYPFVMRNRKIPYQLRIPNIKRDRYNFEFHIKHNYVIASVILRTEHNLFPKHYRNKLIFPIGRYQTTLHQIELQYALEHDLIDDIIEYSVYDADYIFTDYVDFFYDVKKQADISGDLTTRLLSKLFLNSLYGKFGQRNNQTIRLGFSSETGCKIINIYYENQYTKKREIHWYGRKYEIKSEGESAYSFAAIAGSVTSYCRFLLYQYMQCANLHNVLYVDTDSIITNSHGYANLSSVIDQHTLGMLKLEDIATNLTIFGNKDYEYGNQKKIKGIPKGAIEISPGIFTFEAFEGFKQWRNRGASGSPIYFEKTKQRRNDYDKGEVDYVSGMVRPIIIYE